MKKLAGLALLISALSISSGAAAEEQAEIAYARIDEFAQRIRDIEAQPIETRDKLDISMSVSSKAASSDPLRMWMARKSGNVDIPLDAQGGFTLPASPELAAENPIIRINRPKGTVGLEVKLNIKLPPAPFDYAYVAAAAKQLDKAIAAQAPVAFLAPTSGALELDFETGKPGCGVVLKPAAGQEKRLNADKDGKLEIKLSSELAKTNPLITPTCPIAGHDIIPN
jgi:hypothetical protein